MLITDYAIKNRAAVFILALALIVLGGISYVLLPREGPPDVTIPYVFVTAPYEGVAPADIENLITIPLERRFNDLPNVKEVRSSSAEGLALVSIEFTPEQAIDVAVQKVKDKIDLAKPDLPDDLDEPSVRDINFNTEWPVLVFTLSGDTPQERLKRLAEDLEESIEDVPGVLQATVYGGREREIRIELDLQRLAAYGIPLQQIVGLLDQENASVSAGNLEAEGANKFQIRVPGEFTEVLEIEGLVVAHAGGRPVYLRDVARVRDTFKDLDTLTRLNGKPCVSVKVQKRTGQNTVKLVDRVKAVLAASPLPAGVALDITNDQSRDVRMMVAELENNMASGFLLVILVLLVCIGWRNSLLVGVAIPFSMLLSFLVLLISGITLNMIVLFSLVLGVGMLVDNAIVIVENIYRLHGEGLSKRDAALQGAREVAWPVTTSTLTTVVAFYPLLYWPGVMGQFMSYLPITLICTLGASLFVALVINPAIASVFVRRTRRSSSAEDGRTHPFLAAYERLLRFALRNRALTVTWNVCLLVLSVQLYRYYGAGVELFPETDPRSCSVQVKYPEGTRIEQTDATIRAIEAQCAGYGDIRYMVANVGTVGVIQGAAGATGQGSHMGSVDLQFVDFEERHGSSAALVDRIRRELGMFPGAEVQVEKEREGPPTGAPVSIEISGDDFAVLERLAGEVRRRITGVPGLVDVRDDVEDARPEVRFVVDRERAALLGVDTRTVGNFLRSAVNGESATKFRAGEDEYDITVRLPAADRGSVRLFEELRLPVRGGGQVPLSAVGAVRYAGGRGAIRRKDQKRTITISGNNQGRGVDAVLAEVTTRLADWRLPRGYTLTYAGDNAEMKTSGAFLANAFGVAVALIAVVLVLQFNSALLPGIIMASVVLSLMGVLWGLLVCGMRFGIIMTGLGVISLAGIVVNNAIVLIDCVCQLERQGLPAGEAVVRAGRLRLRPVLLTAVTTVLGLVPMAIGYSLEFHTFPPRLVAGTETSAWWAPMAVVVIAGLSVATLLTLVLVPVLYSLVRGLTRRGRTWFDRWQSADDS